MAFTKSCWTTLCCYHPKSFENTELHIQRLDYDCTAYSALIDCEHEDVFKCGLVRNDVLHDELVPNKLACT